MPVRVVGVGVAVLGMVVKEREDRQVDVVALDDDILAGRGFHHFGLLGEGGAAGDLHADLLEVTAQRQRIHGPHAVGVGQEGKLAVLDLLDEDRRVRVLLHQDGQLVHAFFLLDAGQQPGFVQSVDVFGESILRHGYGSFRFLGSGRVAVRSNGSDTKLRFHHS